MRIHFLGAAQTVTGSMHLFESEGSSVVVDCGLFQGRREESREKNRKLPQAVIDADAVILTHAHIDHSGSIPTLVKRGFGGNVYCTPATRDLSAHMLRDSARIQAGDAQFLNEKFGDQPGWVEIQPLYTEADAIAALGRFISVPYGRSFTVTPNITATFLDAGHILGSAEVVLEVREGTRTLRIACSGDLGRKGLPILRDPQHPKGPLDAVLMESTYGNRVHDDVHTMHEGLAKVVKETAERGGKVIVPAFAVGRTQELIYALNVLKRTGKLPDIPVFIDSPLALNITSVFKLHPDCFDEEARKFLEAHGSVFDFDGVRFIESKEESIQLNRLVGPAIIISASGMCEAGRVLHHLRNNVEDTRNTILIVGFMAKHTLGRRLVEGGPRLRILGVERELRAHVVVMNAFSAHADKIDLLAFAEACGKATKRFFLVHGEPDQQEPLKQELTARGFEVVSAPAAGDVVEL